MSLKKFLAATSVVALLAGGSAQALDLTGATVTLANELDFTTAKRGKLDLSIATNNNLPLGNGYRLTVTLTGDLQFRGLTGGAVTGTGVGGAVISTGGQDGSQSVVFLFNTTADGQVGLTNAINLDPEIQVVGSGGGTVSIVLTDPNQSAIEGGNAVLRDLPLLPATNGSVAIPAIGYRSGFAIAVGADAFDSVRASMPTPAYSTFLAGGTPLDTATTATLADISLTVDTRARKSAGNLFVPVDLSDVTGYTISTSFESNTGIAATGVSQPSAAGFTSPTATRVGTVYTATPTGTPTAPVLGPDASQTAVVAQTLLTAAASLAPQRPFVSNLRVNFSATNGFIASEAGGISSIDVIDLQGESEGPFKWVGDAAAGTANAFRVTGLKGTSIPAIFVTIRNSTSNIDGVYRLPTTGKVLSGNTTTGRSELILTNADIEAAVGAPFGRADVTFTFGDGTDGSGFAIDVDRLLLRNNIVSAYGDDLNDQPAANDATN